MQEDAIFQVEGGCGCSAVRYRLTSEPLFVHCCHCRWCQRESGAAFAMNALIEASRVVLLKGEPFASKIPSESGKGQRFYRCSKCCVALWSHYAGMGGKVCFIRVGTLDNPDMLPPDIHIYTDSKQPWVILGDDKPAVSEYYSKKDHWPEASLDRWRAVTG